MLHVQKFGIKKVIKTKAKKEKKKERKRKKRNDKASIILNKEAFE